MNIVCINSDEGFRAFLSQILPKSFNIEFVKLSNLQKPLATDFYILSPCKLNEEEKESLLKLKQFITPIVTFQSVNDVLPLSSVIELDYSVSQKNFLQILRLVKKLKENNQVSPLQHKRHIDYDISRGYIHDINNKLLIPLSAMNTMKNIILSAEKELNLEKFMKVKELAKKSIFEAESLSEIYRKLFLPINTENESFNINENVLSVIKLLKYKSIKANIKLNNKITEQEKILFNGNETSHLQVFTTILAFFLDIKKQNPNSKITQISFNTSKENDSNKLILSIIFDKDSQIEIEKISSSPELKSLFKTLEENLTVNTFTKLKVLKMASSISFQFINSST